MQIPKEVLRYYQSLREINYAVFGVVATFMYSAMYVLFVPLILIFAQTRKKLTHTAWEKWPYKSETVEDLQKQY